MSKTKTCLSLLNSFLFFWGGGQRMVKRPQPLVWNMVDSNDSAPFLYKQIGNWELCRKTLSERLQRIELLKKN